MDTPDRKSWFTHLVEILLGLWTGAILGWSIADNVFDPRFFTYFNYAVGYFFYLAIALSEPEKDLRDFILLFILPIYLGLTIFVYIAIVVIIENNDWVWIRDTLFGGGSLTVGQVHTGDWIFHYLPPVFILIFVLVNFTRIAVANWRLWDSANNLWRFVYSTCVLFTPAIMLGLYMLTMPFNKNYPTHMTSSQTVLLVLGLAIGIQAFYLMAAVSIATTLGKWFYSPTSTKEE